MFTVKSDLFEQQGAEINDEDALETDEPNARKPYLNRRAISRGYESLTNILENE